MCYFLLPLLLSRSCYLVKVHWWERGARSTLPTLQDPGRNYHRTVQIQPAAHEAWPEQGVSDLFILDILRPFET